MSADQNRIDEVLQRADEILRDAEPHRFPSWIERICAKVRGKDVR